MAVPLCSSKHLRSTRLRMKVRHQVVQVRRSFVLRNGSTNKMTASSNKTELKYANEEIADPSPIIQAYILPLKFYLRKA